MNIYPTLKIEYYSSLTTAQVIERIKSRIEPRNVLGFKLMSNKIYIGTVGKNDFLIRKQFSGIPGANPEISGIVENQGNGCKIYLIVSPTLFIKIFMGFWLGFAGLACIFITIEAIFKRDFSWGILIPYAFFTFGYGIMWAGVVFGTDPDDVLIFDLLGEDSQLIK